MRTKPHYKKTGFIEYGVLVALSSLFVFLNLSQEGYGNTYYAAGVKSMGVSWKNLFFVSFDPSGFVSLDKPPLGFWLQTLGTKLFGFSGWALFFPQAISHVLSTCLLFMIMKQAFGKRPAFLAGLIFCLTPINIATARNNTTDSLIVLASLLAMRFFQLYAETMKDKWLYTFAVTIGLGFNIKMTQIFLILPAFLLGNFLIKDPAYKPKVSSLIISAVILCFVSSIWMVVVKITPPQQRPFIGGSMNNDPFNLALYYNGLDRIVGNTQLEALQVSNPAEIGNPGLLRLFTKELNGQITWFIPISLLSGFYLYSLYRKKDCSPAGFWLVIVFGIWLITCILFFSFGSFFHRHYLVMLAPPIAILSGIGIEKSFSTKSDASPGKIMSVLILLLGWGTSWLIIRPFIVEYVWMKTLFWIIFLPSVLSFGFHKLFKFEKKSFARNVLQPATSVLSIGMLLIMPTIWAIFPLIYGGNGDLPFAGPEVLTWNHLPKDVDIEPLLDMIYAKYDREKYYLATLDYNPADWIILKTGLPVMAIGGFYGTDPILTVEDLAAEVHQGNIQLFFLYEKTADELRPDLLEWLHQNCQSLYPGSSKNKEFFQFYHCQNK